MGTGCWCERMILLFVHGPMKWHVLQTGLNFSSKPTGKIASQKYVFIWRLTHPQPFEAVRGQAHEEADNV